MKRRTFSIQDTKLSINGMSVGSTLDRSIDSLTILLIPLIIHKPIISVIIASANFGAYSNPNSYALTDKVSANSIVLST